MSKPTGSPALRFWWLRWRRPNGSTGKLGPFLAEELTTPHQPGHRYEFWTEPVAR